MARQIDRVRLVGILIGLAACLAASLPLSCASGAAGGARMAMTAAPDSQPMVAPSVAPSMAMAEPSPVQAKSVAAPLAPPPSPPQVQPPAEALAATAADQSYAAAESYAAIAENAFVDAAAVPLSTFSIDVDTASYANVRRYLEDGEMPPPDAVRIEELVNYFDYAYPSPPAGQPFAVAAELGDCPWNLEHRLLQIGLQGRRLDYNDIRPANLVFLVDTSGSMQDADKLDLVKEGLGLLVGQLGAKDRVSIVTYAGSAGLALPATSAAERKTILAALDRLAAGGSTAGGEGIELAYATAVANLIQGGNNRVILLTDGDFNVGLDSIDALVELIQDKRRSGVYLTICGVGMGNLKDDLMESIADAGNGNYFYVDSRQEAKKVFVTEMRANLFTIAGDVKIQLEFNPAFIASYRLIGYENRLLAAEDFEDDTKDAGELGAGHTVTAVYELALTPAAVQAGPADRLLNVALRYKLPGEDQSRLTEFPVAPAAAALTRTSDNYRFAAAVAGFGMLLRRSQYAGDFDWAKAAALARGALGEDANGYRREFLGLVERAAALDKARR